MPSPLRLRADNFTPPARTPWGGTRICARYKPRLGQPGRRVGESWEVSVEPSFPSRVEDGRLLSEVIAADPLAWLGAAAVERFGPQLPLLVKLLDAADDLSVQVHPADGDPALDEHESGKPEAWIVLDADPGAGLYIGFAPGVGRAEVEECLASGGHLAERMQFVPVKRGDAFVIEAGTPHAIGRGVTLLEPQIVWPGRRGVTYRFWDWNRRYDAEGRLDPNGRARELHVARSLAVTRWDVSPSCASRTETIAGGPMARCGVVSWRWFDVERWSGSGALFIPATGTLWALTCVGGSARIRSGAGSLELACGESGVVPARAGDLEVLGRDALVFAVRC